MKIIENNECEINTALTIASSSESKLIVAKTEVFTKLVESVLNNFKTHKYSINKNYVTGVICYKGN